MKRFSKPWKALLLAVPMLVCSLSGQAGEYEIEFATPSEGQIKNANNFLIWTYAINGTVNDLKYDADKHVLSFSIPAGGVPENSLTLTTSQRFSGTIKNIDVICSEDPNLTIEVSAGNNNPEVLTVNNYNG